MGQESDRRSWVGSGPPQLVVGRWRCGARPTTERDIADLSGSHDRIRGWVRFDLGSAGGVVAEVGRTPSGSSWAVGFDWYP